MFNTISIKKFWLACLFVLVSTYARADDEPIDPSLGESIVFVKGNSLFSVSLEVTLFIPKEATGKLPVVIVNHGKNGGLNALQPRSRPIPIVRSFLTRGYAVVVPMRQGFSKSGGMVVGEGCDIKGNGEAQADQLNTVVQWLGTQPWADTQRMAMFGQSHGGLTTLAYAQNPASGVKVFVNFAGGLKWALNSCPWENNLIRAFAGYGQRTQAKTLWFYGANDSHFPPKVIKPAFEAYQKAGGKGEMIAFGTFGRDAHGMSGAKAGIPIWLPKTLDYFAEQGLPTDIIYPQYDYAHIVRQIPAPSQFAALNDIGKVPFLDKRGRESYEQFLKANKPRAFVVSPNGAWSWTSTEDTTPETYTLTRCAKVSQNCALYAVDDDVVYMPVATDKNALPSAPVRTSP